MKKISKPKPKPNKFQPTFEQLKKILRKYERRLTVTVYKPDQYSLDAAFSPKYNKEIFFGAVRIQKNYVSFYLMSVYVFPALLKGISPALKKRMQGKSCFNFTAIDDELLAELAALTDKCFKKFESGGMI
jgi:hypothetical protein